MHNHDTQLSQINKLVPPYPANTTALCHSPPLQERESRKVLSFEVPDMAARHYGILKGQINMYLPPGYPLTAI